MAPECTSTAETVVTDVPEVQDLATIDKIVNEDTMTKESVAATQLALQALYDAGDRSPELLWRLSRALLLHCDLCLEDDEETKEAAKNRTMAAFDMMREAVQADPEDWHVQKWRGLAMAAAQPFRELGDTVKDAMVLHNHFLKAIELNPAGDAFLHHCMGNMNLELSQVSWLSRTLATAAYGEMPTGTLEDAEKYLLFSAALNPEDVVNARAVGELYYKKKDYQKAREWFEFAVRCAEKPSVVMTRSRKEKLAMAKERLEKIAKKAKS